MRRAFRFPALAGAIPFIAPLLLGLFTLWHTATAFAQSASEHLKICTQSGEAQTYCEISRTQFIDDFPKAFKRDYQAQRNIAFCLSTGCDGAVMINPTLGCAWRIVIQASGSAKVDATDTMNFENQCGKLSYTQLATASEQAQTLFMKIYKKRLPAAFR